METERSIVRVSDVKLPKFVEQAYDSIEGMKQFANMLLESKLVPDSYYERGPDNKPDYSKGKTSAVVIVLLQAQQLAVPPMTGLQHIVPVNGLLSIKGDLAKTMIFASGKLKKGSWVESVTGSIEEENMVVTITATREDNGITTSRSFSVEKAKRMGLWVTSTQANSADGWRVKKSAWYKTPDRMLFYRCLGNLARDLFSDVLLNMYTTEEAVDIDRDVTEVIETESGTKITIPDKEFSEARSKKVTARAIDKIEAKNFAPVNRPEPEMQPVTIASGGLASSVKDEPAQAESPFISERGSVEMFDGKITKIDGKELSPEAQEERKDAGEWTVEIMSKMDTELLVEKINTKSEMIEAMVAIPGKNTNKKLREIIDAWQRGKLDMLTAPFQGKKIEEIDAVTGQIKEEQVQTNADIQPNINFDKMPEEREIKLEKPLTNELNKYGLPIPEWDKGNEREFSTTKKLYNDLLTVNPRIDNERWLELRPKLPSLEKYKNKEEFLKFATVKEICDLLNAN